MITTLVNILFLLLAVALVLYAFWPGLFSGTSPRPGPGITPAGFLVLLLELVALAIVYVLIATVFFGGAPALRTETLSPFAAGGLLIGATEPYYAAGEPGDGGYTGRYWLNVVLVALSVLSVVANVLAQQNAAFLGVSEVAWHWVLLVAATVTALNAAFNRTPPVTKPPTASRVAVEKRVAAIRKATT